MAANGVGYITQVLGGLDSELYCKIKTEDMLPLLEEYDMSKDDIIFQHNIDPKHTVSGKMVPMFLICNFKALYLWNYKW